MSRPLIISDCDEVLLHMVVPFGQWLDETHGISFDLNGDGFAEALRHKHDGSVVDEAAVWPLLDGFFTTEMHRQQPIIGSIAAMQTLSASADVVVLTNLLDHRREARREQLRAHGLDCEVHTNQGGKGRPVAALVERFAPSVTIFIDDLANHHDSVARHAPDVWRIHMVGEPALAPHYPHAPHAHARIDRWDTALAWIGERLASPAAAPPLSSTRP